MHVWIFNHVNLTRWPWSERDLQWWDTLVPKERGLLVLPIFKVRKSFIGELTN
mgnify:CR=1 FL=1